MALSFQEVFPDPMAARPCRKEASSTVRDFEYTFPGTAPQIGAFSHCKLSSFIFPEFWLFFLPKLNSTLLKSSDLASFRPDLRRLFQPLRTNVYK